MKPPQQTGVYSVDALTAEIKKLLEMSYADVWVEGEVSSLASPPSGHLYFTLKDTDSILKCVLFKNKKYLSASLPIEGEKVLIRGRVSVYTARGDVQMICSYIEAAGEGDLRRQFDELKSRLMAEGLFDESRKQAIPKRPKIIALITSSHGAVLHDIISTLKQRYPLARLNLYPATVQGEKATTDILNALKQAIQHTPDVIIIARGGGSLEDLQAFNDETVARAVSVCKIPIVSAIGHETDFVITDFVADMRAPTPTAAAALITPDIKEINASLTQFLFLLNNRIQIKLDTGQQRLDFAAQRLKHPRERLRLQAGELQQLRLRLSAAYQKTPESGRRRLEHLRSSVQLLSPKNRLVSQRHALETLSVRLDQLVAERLNKERARLKQNTTALQAFSPLQTLKRGYSILQNQQGEIVRSSEQVVTGEHIHARLHEGELDVQVNRKTK